MISQTKLFGKTSINSCFLLFFLLFFIVFYCFLLFFYCFLLLSPFITEMICGTPRASAPSITVSLHKTIILVSDITDIEQLISNNARIRKITMTALKLHRMLTNIVPDSTKSSGQNVRKCCF